MLKLDFLNVGDGDAILLREESSDYVMLVDTGRPHVEFTKGSKRRACINHLREEGVDHIDMMVLTHLHFDHIGGLIDLPRTTVVYVGAGEAEQRSRANTLLGHPADAILEGFGPLREWAFQPDPDGVFDGVLDVFGDGSVWAIRVPGHSPGSTAYLINAVGGPKLVVGDAVSTRLGWDEGMPQPVAAAARADADASADRLRRFAAAHPGIEVFLGHQLQTDRTDLPRTAPTAASGF